MPILKAITEHDNRPRQIENIENIWQLLRPLARISSKKTTAHGFLINGEASPYRKSPMSGEATGGPAIRGHN